MTSEEAEDMLAKLSRHFNSPVMPLARFCTAIEQWMDCIEKLNLGEPDGLAQGHFYYMHLRQIRTDIRKSNLLARLLLVGEAIRTESCPEHKEHLDSQAMFFSKCPHGCGGTGWLPAKPDDKGYRAGISLLRREGDQWVVQDPESGQWKETQVKFPDRLEEE